MSQHSDRRRTVSTFLLEALERRALMSAAFPTAFDQYMVELINRARMDPGAEAARFSIDLNEGLDPGTLADGARQPLAINLFATSAAQLHSADLLENFNTLPPDHRGSDGKTPSERVAAAGVDAPTGENNAWSSHSGSLTAAAVDKLHQLLFKDFTNNFEVVGRGHRKNILRGDYSEIGAGVLKGTFGSNSAALGTMDFLITSATYLTGVIYRDTVKDDAFYTPGEGVGSVTITATRQSDSMEFSTTTWDAGGYTLELPEGVYDVVASGEALTEPMTVNDIAIAADNVKQDFVVAGTGGGGGGGGEAGPANLTGVLTLKKPMDAAVPGDTVALTLAVTNSGGTAAGAFTVELRRSDDATLDDGDTLLVTVQSAKPIAPGKTVKVLINVPITQDDPIGDSFFIADIDTTDAIAETSDADNTSSLAAPEIRWSAGTLGNRRNVSLTLPDRDGVATTFLLKGAGEAVVDPTDQGFDIVITGSDATTSLSIVSANPNTVHSITSDGAMKDIKAGNSNVIGDLTTGAIKAMLLRSASFADITAPSIGSLTVVGDLGSHVTLTDANAAVGLGKLNVGGVVRAARVRAASHIGTIAVNGAEDSLFSAGVNFAVDSPTSLPELGTGTIKSFTQKAGSFLNTLLAAGGIKKVALVDVQTDNGGDELGIITANLGSFGATPSTPALPPLKKLVAPTDDASGDLEDDFIVRVLGSNPM